MDFKNETGLNAAFLNSVLDEDRMIGAVIARPLYGVEEGVLRLLGDDSWPIDMAPKITPYGEFPGDQPFLSGGVDLFVVGSARAPGGRTAARLRMEISVGASFRRWIDVVGDRVWLPGPDGQLLPSEPELFAAMPLRYENAFGGKVQLPEGEFAWPANPYGKGFYASPEQAQHQPLPNLEDPHHPIRAYGDQPEPVCTAPYPKDGSLRALSATTLKPDQSFLERVSPLFFNAAHPALVIPVAEGPKGGDRVRVTNVGPDGLVEFTLPMQTLHVHVQLEDRSHLCPLHLDQIGILADEGKVFLSYRVVYSYRLIPLERRLTTLHVGPVPAHVPAEYVSVWED